MRVAMLRCGLLALTLVVARVLAGAAGDAADGALVRRLGSDGAAQPECAKPVVGIYPTVNWDGYLNAYQLWVQQFGAQTVVLPTDGDAEHWFKKLDAFLIPGGPSFPVPAFVARLLHRAADAAQEGVYFPVWGTCLGFEWIIETVGGTAALEYKHFDAMDEPARLRFLFSLDSDRLFKDANSSFMNWLVSEDITYEDHRDGIEPTRFDANPALSKAFDVLATSRDREGRPYVAVIQGKRLPWYGVQFHPEKVRYVSAEAAPNVPRSPEAIAVADYLAAFFVGEACEGARGAANASNTSVATAARVSLPAQPDRLLM